MSASPKDIRMPLPDGGRIPRVGKLRLGIKIERMRDDGSAFSYPSKVDYFVVNEDASTSRQSAESFHEVYGAEPRELDIVLPAHRTEDVLEGAYRQYGTGGKLKRKCTGPDGQCVTRDDAGDWNAGPCWCEANNLPLEVKSKKGEMVKNPERCQLRYTLTVMLMRVAGVGCWQLDTGSIMAGEGLTASLRMLEQFRGHLQGAQATLRVVPKQVAPGGKATTVYIVELGSLDITPQQALAIASEKAQRVALPASSLDDEPDPLLDADQHEQIEAGTVEVEEAAPYNCSALLKAMNARDLSELYTVVGIKKGTKVGEVQAILRAELELLEMPDNPQPDPMQILALHRLRKRALVENDPQAVEAFQRFADTGEDLDPGDQASLTELDAEARV